MTTLNIRIRALEHNIEIIKSLAADAQIIAVLKGNAYGLGLCKFDDFYAGMPVLTCNSFGTGKAYYVATRSDGEFYPPLKNPAN